MNKLTQDQFRKKLIQIYKEEKNIYKVKNY